MREGRLPPWRGADTADPVPLGIRPDGGDVLQGLLELCYRRVEARGLSYPF